MRTKLLVLSLVVLFFGLGWASSNLYATFTYHTTGGVVLEDSVSESPATSSGSVVNIFPRRNMELASPGDRVQEDMIHVYSDGIELDIKNATWARFLNTNSMDPILDYGTNGIEVMPSGPEDIDVGDIISYKSELVDGLIVHRVIEKGADAEGFYYKVKGDNNPSADPEKVRFDMINGVVVALIY